MSGVKKLLGADPFPIRCALQVCQPWNF